MSFLAPLFLLGIAAIALPFWLHRLQTQSSDRKPFGSAMLLETTEQQVHVRKKLKYFTLLALRIAALLIAALIFAKPLWTRPDSLPGPGPDGTHVLLIDTSASMGRSGAFEQAIAEARRTIASVPGDAMLQILTADAELQVWGDASAVRTDHAGTLSGISPGMLRLDFGHVMAAVDRHIQLLPQPVTLHLISDFQDSAMPVRFADLVAEHVSSLQAHVVGTGQAFNWKIDYVRAAENGVDVGVFGYGDAERAASAELFLNDVSLGRRGLTSTGPTSLHFDVLPTEAGDNRLQVNIEADDDLKIDNRAYYVIENTPPEPIPLLTLNQDGLPVTYLSAALQADPSASYRIESMVIGDFDIRTLTRYRWLIVDDIGSIDSELEAALIEYVQAGGSILAFAGQRSAGATRIPVTGNTTRPASVGVAEDQFLSIGQVDSGHPLLAGTNGWYSVNVSQNIPVEPHDDDQVLIRLQNDEPFLIERKLGTGRVLLVTGGLQNQWNDLPLRPVFVSFVIEAARYLSNADQIARTFAAGASLPLSVIGGTSGQVIDPDGQTVLSLTDTTQAQQVILDKTGFYEVYTSQGDYIVAVNVDPRESDLQAATAATLERWTAATQSQSAPLTTATLTAAPESVELWHILLLVLVVVLIAESLLGNAYLAPRNARSVN